MPRRSATPSVTRCVRLPVALDQRLEHVLFDELVRERGRRHSSPGELNLSEGIRRILEEFVVTYPGEVGRSAGQLREQYEKAQEEDLRERLDELGTRNPPAEPPDRPRPAKRRSGSRQADKG